MTKQSEFALNAGINRLRKSKWPTHDRGYYKQCPTCFFRQYPRERLLNVMISRACTEDDVFADVVVTALREYADSLEKFTENPFGHKPENEESLGRDHSGFSASNRCRVVVVAGFIPAADQLTINPTDVVITD